MTRRTNPKSARHARRLYFSAKISDYKFMKVLWQFVLDRSAVEASRYVRLSPNSIGAIYSKLRKFFFDYGLFSDPYRGGDPRNGLPHDGFMDIEHLILTFHLKRVSEKRGQLDSPMEAIDYHFAESNWRFEFHNLQAERGADAAQRMMYANLLEYIRRFGPVGAKGEPTARMRREGLYLAMAQLNQRILWLERNSARFRDPEQRMELRKLREE